MPLVSNAEPEFEVIAKYVGRTVSYEALIKNYDRSRVSLPRKITETKHKAHRLFLWFREKNRFFTVHVLEKSLPDITCAAVDLRWSVKIFKPWALSPWVRNKADIEKVVLIKKNYSFHLEKIYGFVLRMATMKMTISLLLILIRFDVFAGVLNDPCVGDSTKTYQETYENGTRYHRLI